LELKKLLLSSNNKEGACRHAGSPKTEGTSRKEATAQQQVCEQEFLL
jgi:hypothetical protein